MKMGQAALESEGSTDYFEAVRERDMSGDSWAINTSFYWWKRWNEGLVVQVKRSTTCKDTEYIYGRQKSNVALNSK